MDVSSLKNYGIEKQATRLINRHIRFEEKQQINVLKRDLYYENLTFLKRNPWLVFTLGCDRNIDSTLCCKSCVPSSHSNITEDGLHGFKRDILDINQLYAQKGYHLTRFIKWFMINPKRKNFFVTQRQIDFMLNGKIKPKNRSLFPILGSIWSIVHSQISLFVSAIVGYYAYYYLIPKFTRKLIIHSSQMAFIEKTINRGLPIIYITDNKTPLKYLFLCTALYYTGLQPPVIFLQKDQKIKFGGLQRWLGCCFVPYCSNIDRDEIMKYCLLNKIPIALNVADSSYTSCSANINGDLFSNVVNLFVKNEFDDAAIVSTTFSYDNLFINPFQSDGIVEQNGTGFSKKFLSKKSGISRLTLNQPFSLMEFVSLLSSYRKPVSYNEIFSNINSDNDYPNTSGVVTSKDLYDLELVKCTTESIIRHIMYDQFHSRPVMSINIVCFLLLTKYRSGTTISQLAFSFNEICHRLKVQGTVIGFSGKAEDIVNYVLNIAPSLFVLEVRDNETSVTANFDQAFMTESFYYASFLSSNFVLTSIVLFVINYLHNNNKIYAITDGGYIDGLKLYRDEIVKLSKHLCSVLRWEFVFVKPCESVENAITNIVDYLHHKSVLIKPQEMFTEEEQTARRLANYFEEENYCSDTEDDVGCDIDRSNFYYLNTEEGMQEENLYLKGIIEPYLDVYSMSAYYLENLRNTSISEDEYISRVLSTGKGLVENEIIVYKECLNEHTIKNSIQLFIDLHVVLRFKENGQTFVCLTHSYNDSDTMLKDLCESISTLI